MRPGLTERSERKSDGRTSSRGAKPRGISTIYIAGHTGLVGSGLWKHFGAREGIRLVGAVRSELDLTESEAVREFLQRERPDAVILAAGRVGGIQANSRYPAQFLYENLMMEANLIHEAWKADIRTLLNFGSSCMYPKGCEQPMRPQSLMTGRLEPTSEPYAIAKLAGLALCEAYNRQHGTRYMTAIPCTVYGPGDHFDPEEGHVLPALLWKFHRAKEQDDGTVTLWGTGQARREFIHVEDLAEACEILLEGYEGTDPVNIGSSESVSICELAHLIAEVVGFRGAIDWDSSRPDGAPDKRLDSSAIHTLGWRPRVDLREGIERAYRWFLRSTIHDPRSTIPRVSP